MSTRTCTHHAQTRGLWPWKMLSVCTAVKPRTDDTMVNHFSGELEIKWVLQLRKFPFAFQPFFPSLMLSPSLFLPPDEKFAPA